MKKLDWIDINIQLPEDNDDVLVTDGKSIDVMFFERSRVYGDRWVDNSLTKNHDFTITHWQYIRFPDKHKE